MRPLTRAALLGIVLLFVRPSVLQAAGVRDGRIAAASRALGRATAPVKLQISVGYQGIYRVTAWTPVRVTLHNQTGNDIRGTLELPQSSQLAATGLSSSFHALYEAPVVLPAGGTKHVTLYAPGSGIQGQATARFRESGRTVATGAAHPLGIDSSALLIGVMAGSPSDSAWLVPAIQRHVMVHAVPLTLATFDAVPQALAAFDLILLSNTDTSQLDAAQLGALQRYVDGGGSLLLVGGPAWQETLLPLPASLVPGHLTGTRVLPDLGGLRSLGRTPSRGGSQTAAVSDLSRPTGIIVASQAGIPLVVRRMEGQGVIEYLAFDPSLDPVQHWSSAPRLLEHLVAMAAPMAITRTWSPQLFRTRFQTAFNTTALTTELSNLPAATVPLLAIFAVLTLLYVLVLGPANFLVLRLINHQQLAWLTIPALALSYVGSGYAITQYVKNSAVLLNSIAMVTLGGNGETNPATVYLGLDAPLPGDYRLTYSADALPTALPGMKNPDGFFFQGASTLHSTPLGMRLQEGTQTVATFLSMKRWSIRDMILDTTTRIQGRIGDDLGVGARGTLSGDIHNGTSLDLLDPVIVAGQAVTHLPAIVAGATVHVTVSPTNDRFNQDPSSMWGRLYGGSDLGTLNSFGGFDDQFSLPPEPHLIDRLRNVMAVLSQVRALASLGQVVLVGWSERPIGTFAINGSIPRQRALTLVVTPLSVHFPSHGPFLLRPGILNAHLVDVLPRAPQSNTFGFLSDSGQPAGVGSGGSLTFEFDLPSTGRIRFRRLAVSVSSSDYPINAAQVYDWRTSRWVNVDLSSGVAQLSSPNRFVSPDGQILVKVLATGGGDVTINDPYHDIQLSGSGTVT